MKCLYEAFTGDFLETILIASRRYGQFSIYMLWFSSSYTIDSLNNELFVFELGNRCQTNTYTVKAKYRAGAWGRRENASGGSYRPPIKLSQRLPRIGQLVLKNRNERMADKGLDAERRHWYHG
jgi:hypothetical protein